MNKKESINQLPELLSEENLNLQGLRQNCENYVNKVIANKGYPEDSDDEHYIFEEALKAFYGKGIFEYLNLIAK